MREYRLTMRYDSTKFANAKLRLNKTIENINKCHYCTSSKVKKRTFILRILYFNTLKL